MAHEDEALPAADEGPVQRTVRRLVAVLRWPARPGSTLVPWYVIGWRLVWAPAIYLGFALTFAGIAAANGPQAARDWWRMAA